MIVIFAMLHARPGRRDDLIAALDAIRLDAHHEPGTLVFAVHTASDDDRTVLCYEAYADDDAISSHREGRALRALMDVIGDLVDGPPELHYASLVGATGLPSA